MKSLLLIMATVQHSSEKENEMVNVIYFNCHWFGVADRFYVEVLFVLIYYLISMKA